MRYLAWLLLLAAAPAYSQVQIENAWSRATAPGATVAAGYMLIRNTGASADRLVGASSPAAARVETHVTVKDGDIRRMRKVQGYDVPAGGSFELEPGGAHLMLVDIKQPFKAGERIPATLKFEKAGEVRIELRVEPLGGQRHGHGQGHGSGHGHGH